MKNKITLKKRANIMFYFLFFVSFTIFGQDNSSETNTIPSSNPTFSPSDTSTKNLNNDSDKLEEFKLLRYEMYPNPSYGTINIDTSFDADLVIVNQTGQVFKSFNIKANAKNVVKIDELAAGTYFLKSAKCNHIKVQKLVVK